MNKLLSLISIVVLSSTSLHAATTSPFGDVNLVGAGTYTPPPLTEQKKAIIKAKNDRIEQDKNSTYKHPSTLSTRIPKNELDSEGNVIGVTLPTSISSSIKLH